MVITRRCPLTHTIGEMDLPVTEEQVQAWKGGALVQEVFPNLSPEEREFLMTGITPETWARFFPEEGDDEE